MKRERPEYLPPISARRWSFPWMALWAVLLLGMAGAGIWLHIRTNAAWTARFNQPPRAETPQAAPPQQEAPSDIDARFAKMAEIRARREQAEHEARREREGLRCIGGVAFRRIPGGWENVPGETCP